MKVNLQFKTGVVLWRKITAAAVALTVLLSSFSASFAAAGSTTTAENQSIFKDVKTHWAKNAIIKWSGYGIINGYGGLFRPNDSITRGEIACILNTLMGYREAAKNTYSDLKTGQFYTDAVLKAKAAGVLVDDGDAFIHPTEKLTREEAVVILAKALAVEDAAETAAFKDAGSIASWAKPAVFGMEAKGYIKGNNGKFNPKTNITRAEIVTIINNIVKAYYTKAGTYTEDVKGTAVIKAPDVILKGMSISGNLIIAEGVGKGNATLESVTVKANTVVRGGGENSIHISGTSNITSIKIEKSGDTVRIVVADNSTVQELKVTKGEEIIITGSVGTLEIETADATIYATSANILKAAVKGQNTTIVVDKETKIGSVSVENTAQNTSIKTEKGSAVGSVASAAKIAISGEGTVEKVALNKGANNSSISTPNTQTKVDESVTGATAGGGAPLAPGSTTTNNSTGGIAVTPPTTGGGNTTPTPTPTPTVIPVSSVTVSPASITLTAGGANGTITATVQPENATNKNVAWSSGNTGVATVTNGIVTPLAAGTTTITAISATDSTKFASTLVTVVSGDTPGDTTPPEFIATYPKTADIRTNSFDILVKANEEVTCYYVEYAHDTGRPDPDVDQVIAGTDGNGSDSNLARGSAGPFPANTEIPLNFTQLNALTAYDVFVVAVDAANNKQLTVTKIPVTTLDSEDPEEPEDPDTMPPVLSNGAAINLGSQDGTTASIEFQTSSVTVDTNCYFIVQPSEAAAPGAAAIKASNQWCVVSEGITNYQINLAELTAGQQYTAYLMMEAAGGNISNILTISGINPYSNAVLPKLGTPGLALSSNSTTVGGLSFAITPAAGSDSSLIKEYYLVIASASEPDTPVRIFRFPVDYLSGNIEPGEGITAGDSYVARVRAVVADHNMTYQSSDFSANTAAAVAQAENAAGQTMDIVYVSTFNKDEKDRSLQFCFEGSNDASADSLTIDTAKLKIIIGSAEHQFSNYTKASSGLPGTYQLLYGQTPNYVRVYLTQEDYNAIVNDVNFTSLSEIRMLKADSGWASINNIASGKDTSAPIDFSRNLAIINNSDEYTAKYRLPQSYHYKLEGNMIENIRYSDSSVDFYSEWVSDSSDEPSKGYKITKTISAGDTTIVFEAGDTWTRLSSEATPENFAPADQYYKVDSADTDRVVIGGTGYKVAQGVAGRINSMLTVNNGNTVDYSNALMFKFTADGKLEAIKAVGEVTVGIDLVGHFAPAGIPVYLDSDTAKLTVMGENTIGNITVLNAVKNYSDCIWIAGGQVGDIVLIDGVTLRISGYKPITQVGDVEGTGAFTVAIDVDSVNGRKVSIGNIDLGNAGKLDLYQNDANDLSEEYFTVGNVTATTDEAIIVIPNASNVNCDPYGWFMKFSDLSGNVTFMSSNDVYTPPTGEITINGGNSSSPALKYGVFTYYDTETYKWRFFFTDAIISPDDLSDQSKTFKFTAVDPATHKSNLMTE